MARQLFKLKTISAAIITSVALTGCGGGGGGSNVIPSGDNPEIIVPAGPTYYEQQSSVNIDAVWDGGAKGQGVTIGLVDSGITAAHEDFQDQLGASRIDTVNAAGFDYDGGFNVIQVPNYSDTASDYHGTHVASIAAGKDYGLAPEATILPVNVQQNNGATIWSDILAAGIAYAAPHAQVVNASISGLVNPTSFGTGNAYDTHVATLSANDTILVAAAGNSAEAVGVQHFDNNNIAKNLGINPAVEGRVFNVVALNSDNTVASFSNTPGSCADIGASPDIACDNTVMEQIQNTFISAVGVNIQAADGATTDGSKYLSGTSMATPIVSGTLASLLSEWDQLSETDAAQIVRDTANDSFAGYDASLHGVGIIDAEAALAPIGVLKAAASGGATSITPDMVSARVPSSLAGIKDISALKQAAFYDDYNRDFALDLTSSIEVVQKPIDWNAHWNQSTLAQHYGNTVDIGDDKLTMAFNPSNPNLLDAMTLAGKDYTLSFGQGDKAQKMLDSLVNTNGFVSGQNVTGNTLATKFNIAKGMSLTGSINWQDSYELHSDDNGIDTSSQLGLTYEAADNFTIGAGVEWINQKNSLAGLSGEASLSLGANNLTQLGVLSAKYSSGNNEFFGLVKAGNVVDSQDSASSYLQVKDAVIGQTVLGFRSQLDKETQLGVKAFNDLGITSATLNLNVPSGMDSNGNMEYAKHQFKHRGSMTPNTLEMFYSVSPAKGIKYQVNALTGQDDSGVGIRVVNQF